MNFIQPSREIRNKIGLFSSILKLEQEVCSKLLWMFTSDDFTYTVSGCYFWCGCPILHTPFIDLSD